MSPSWKLWLDDQLDDITCPNRHTPIDFYGAKSTQEAWLLVSEYGVPEYMDLDHDLGNDDNAMRFLRMLSNVFPNGPIPDYSVHSENPVGKKNIESFMDSWKRSVEI